MSQAQKSGIADVGDRHRRRAAISMLLMGLALGALAARQWFERGTDERLLLGLGALTLIVAAFGFFVPIIVWKVRHLWGGDSRSCRLYRGEDGFVAEALSRAHIASWMTTVVFLGLFGGWDDLLTIAPPRFLINLTMAVLLGSFGVAFLILDRDAAESNDWEIESGA